MTKIASWIPIGNGSFVATASESKVEGAAFEGTFDGQGHALLNCKMTGALTSDNQVYGLFGILKGATVRNLVLGAESGDTGSFTVSGNGTTSTGVIAGACVDSKIEKCTSYLPMVCEGNNSANKLMTMGLVGFVYGAGTSEDTVSQLTDLTNYGALKADPGAANANGFTSTQVGGIAGFSNTSRTSTFANRFLRCINHGDMTVSTGRASGIVAAANTFTHIVECENYGDMMNTYAGSKGGRLGNITCILGTQSIINGCTNHGDVVTTNSQSHAGGLLCLSNATDCEIINSANYGNVISDLTTYRGTLVANINSLGKMDNNIAGGGIGSYNGGDYEMVAINEMNFMDYIGKIKAGNEERVTNTKYGGEVSTAKGIRTARGSRGCGQLRQAARRMAKRKRRDLPADRHRHVRGRRMDTHRQGDLRHRKQQTHGLRNPLRRTFQRPGLPDPQSENGRCEQRGGGYIRIVRNFGTRRRDREFLVRHRLFVHRRVHSRFIERRSGRTGLRRYGA